MKKITTLVIMISINLLKMYGQAYIPTSGGTSSNSNFGMGVGASTPISKFEIRHDENYQNPEWFNHPFSIRNEASYVNMGVSQVSATNQFAYLQSLHIGVGTGSLSLNPNGGNVGIFTVNPNARLEVGVTHAVNQDEEVRLGSIWNNGFLGIALNYRIDGQGYPSKHIVNHEQSGRHTMLTFNENHTGVNCLTPNSKLEVGVPHNILQDEEMRIGSYYWNTFLGIGFNYRININGIISSHIVNYASGQRYTAMTFENEKVYIGNTRPTGAFADYKFAVDGKIVAQRIQVETAFWADKVFAKEYKLMSLKEVEEYVIKNKHLPEIPAEKEMLTSGIDMGKMQVLQMQKIEELTLYIIEQNKKLENVETELAKIKETTSKVSAKSKGGQ